MQLLETFRYFKRALRESGNLGECLPAVGIHSDMFKKRVGRRPSAWLAAPHERNYAAAEIHGIAVVVDYDFRRVGIRNGIIACAVAAKWFSKCCNLCATVVKTAAYRFYLRTVDERLVTLYVYYHIMVCAEFCHGLLYAICAAFVVRRGHNDIAAKLFDSIGYTLVVRGYTYVSQHAGHLFVNSSYYIFSAEHSQRFAGKAGGGISGGNYSDKFHVMLIFRTCFIKFPSVFMTEHEKLCKVINYAGIFS